MAGYIGDIPVPQATQTRQSFTATASQTSFPTIGYTAGFIDVYLNGIKLLDTVDYAATNGSDVVLTTGAALNDILEVTIFDTFTTSSGTTTNATHTSSTLKSNVTLKNDTEEDSDGGRSSKIIYQGEQSGGEITTLAEIQASHDGSSDDEKGELILRVNDGNDGASPSEVMRIDSLGNVGIGTNTIDVSTQAGGSGYKALQIESDEGGQLNFDHNDAGTGSTLGQINFQRAGEVVAEIEGVTDGATDNGRISFRTQPDGGALTERWRITHDGHLKAATDGIGIDFSAAETSSGVTIDDSLLDDYEQGTFNFEMVGYHGSPSPKLTIGAHYTKIGNVVYFWAHRASMNTTSYSSNMWFTGLPFTAPSPYSIGNISLDYIGTYTGYGPHTLVSGNTVYAILHQSNASAWSAVMHNVVTSNGAVYLSGHYKIA